MKVIVVVTNFQGKQSQLSCQARHLFYSRKSRVKVVTCTAFAYCITDALRAWINRLIRENKRFRATRWGRVIEILGPLLRRFKYQSIEEKPLMGLLCSASQHIEYFTKLNAICKKLKLWFCAWKVELAKDVFWLGPKTQGLKMNRKTGSDSFPWRVSTTVLT